MEDDKKDDYGILKRYRLRIVLVVVLMVIGVGCWLVEKRGSDNSDSHKDDARRQLDQSR